MRLIDADALRDTVKGEKEKAEKNIQDKLALSISKIVLGWCIDKIAAAPTIDPEELRPKGEWKRVEDSECYWYECSECGEPPLKHYKYDCFSNYCPNCGLKMEGVDG